MRVPLGARTVRESLPIVTPAGVRSQTPGKRSRPEKPVSTMTRMGAEVPTRMSTVPLWPLRPGVCIVRTGSVTVTGTGLVAATPESVAGAAEAAGTPATIVAVATSPAVRARMRLTNPPSGSQPLGGAPSLSDGDLECQSRALLPLLGDAWPTPCSSRVTVRDDVEEGERRLGVVRDVLGDVGCGHGYRSASTASSAGREVRRGCLPRGS